MVNSAAAGLRRKVSSVREAILVLGPRSLVGWVLLMSMSGTAGGAAVNVDVALTRARMCELLSPHGPTSPGPAFTVGLVASLEMLLGMPLAEAIEDLPLDSEVTDAVLRQKGALGRVLADVLAYEAQTPTRLVSLADARAAYVSAMAWTQDVLTRAGN
jgi:EAL and modified HD-GYP domain-containing signal transduction protein